jgi:hypothetical protein
LIDDGSAADPRLGFVERRQAEAAHTDEIIERIKGAPTATDEISMHEQVFMGAPGAAANVERHLSGRALSGNMVPSIPLPPVRVGES